MSFTGGFVSVDGVKIAELERFSVLKEDEIVLTPNELKSIILSKEFTLKIPRVKVDMLLIYQLMGYKDPLKVEKLWKIKHRTNNKRIKKKLEKRIESYR